MTVSPRGIGRIILLVLAIAVGTHVFAASANPTLKITGSLWSPYVDPALPNHGLAADLVGTALQRAGYTLDANVETWPRAFKGVSIGIYDVVVAIWESDVRARDLLFSTPYLTNELVFLSKKGFAADYRSLFDVEGMTIGVVNQYVYGGGFEQHPRLRRVANNHLTQNLLLLRSGRIDLVIGDRWAIYHELSRFMPDVMHEFTALEPPLVRRGLRMGVSKQYPNARQLLLDFEAAIDEMRKDGTFDQIVKKHTQGFEVKEPN